MQKRHFPIFVLLPMDITKRFDRILNLFFFLQSKAVVTMAEMKARFGTTERTLYRDLKALQAAGVPVLNEAGAGYSIMEGYRVQPTRFTEEEMLSLVVAEKMMQQHETQFIKQHFDAALVKVKGSFRHGQKDAQLQLADRLLVTENTRTSNYLPNVLDVLLNSILKKKTATLHYQKGNEEEPTIRQVEPVGVFYEIDHWYVLAWCHLRKDYRNFRLDRIRRIDLSGTSFTIEHPSIQQLREKKSPKTVHPIVVRADAAFAHYLTWERDHFGFEKEVVADGSATMYFNCEIDTAYFVRWFMMFADIAEIVSPLHLQQELADIIHAAAGRIKKTAPEEVLLHDANRTFEKF